MSRPNPGPNHDVATTDAMTNSTLSSADRKGLDADVEQSLHLATDSKENQQRLPKIISFETLSRCGDEIWIENAGQIYRLRRTKQGKLILTK